MKKASVLTLTLAVSFCLLLCTACQQQGGEGPDTSTPQPASSIKEDAIKIEEIDWKVEDAVIEGNRRVAFSYTNNSSYDIVEVELQFTQRPDATEEELSLLDHYIEDSNTATLEDLTLKGYRTCLVAPGETSNPYPCTILAHYVPDIAEYNLMEPSIMTITFLGGDGYLYWEYYDFVNQSYNLGNQSGEKAVDEAGSSPLAKELPSFEAPVLKIQLDDEDIYAFLAYGVSQESFEDYVNELQNKGFSQVDFSNNIQFKAYNEEGHEVNVNYNGYSDELYTSARID